MATVYTNKTPWDTVGLEKLLGPLAEGLGVETIVIKTLTPMPGVKASEQRQAEVCTDHYNADFRALTVELLSPKRAGKRTDTLDRLSLVEDLKPHETALPEKAVAIIEHAFGAMRNFLKRGRNRAGGGTYEIRSCMAANCKCKYEVQNMVLIKGDTKARIKPPVSVKDLERKLHWAEESVTKCQKDLDEAVAKRNRLLERVERLREKQPPAMSG